MTPYEVYHARLDNNKFDMPRHRYTYTLVVHTHDDVKVHLGQEKKYKTNCIATGYPLLSASVS